MTEALTWPILAHVWVILTEDTGLVMDGRSRVWSGVSNLYTQASVGLTSGEELSVCVKSLARLSVEALGSGCMFWLNYSTYGVTNWSGRVWAGFFYQDEL